MVDCTVNKMEQMFDKKQNTNFPVYLLQFK